MSQQDLKGAQQPPSLSHATALTKMMKFLAIIAGIVCLTIGGLAFYGSLLEESLPIESRIEVAAPAAEVWSRLTHFDQFPSWQESIAKVEQKKQLGSNQFVWVEHYKDGRQREYTVFIDDANLHMELKESDEQAPLKYSWNIAVQPVDEHHAEVEIQGETRVEHPILRLILHKFIDIDIFSQDFLGVLKASFDEL